MGSIADLYVAVRAQMDGFEKEIVQGAQKSGAKAGDVAGDSMGKSLGDKLKKHLNKGLFTQLATGLGAGGPIGLAVSGISGIVSVLGEAGRAASDLSETESKLTQVFPIQAEAISKWAETSAQKMGLSSKAALESVGTFGNFLQAMGTVPPVAADMSQAMVQLAADLGSFNNQDPTQVLGALQSGLSGETEPLRRFGVDISDAAVQAELMAQGVQKVGKAFTQGQKIQGRYALIMKQTAKAQGDYARTATGTANATRTAAAEQENLKARVGSLVNTFQNMVTTMVGSGAGAVINAIDAVGQAFNDLQRWIDPTSAAVEDANDLFLELAEGKGFDSKVVEEYAALQDDVTAKQEKLNHVMTTTAAAYRALQGWGDEYVMTAEEIVLQTEYVNKELVRQGLILEDGVTPGWKASAQATEIANAELALYIKAAGLATKTGLGWAGMLDEITTRMEGDPTLTWRTAIDQIGIEFERGDFVPKAESGARRLVSAYVQAWDSAWKAEDPFAGMAEENAAAAERSMAAAVEAARAEAAELVPSIRTEIKSRLGQVRDVMRDLKYALTHPWSGIREAVAIEAALNSKELRQALKSQDPAIRAEAQDRKRWLLARLQELTTETKVKAFLTSEALEKGLKSKDPKVREQWRERRRFARRQLALIQEDARLAALAISSYFEQKFGIRYAHAAEVASRHGGEHLAEGGPAIAGRTYMIGERGPEMFVPKVSGTVIPNHELGGAGRMDVRVFDERVVVTGPMGSRTVAIASQAQSVRRWED